MTCDGPTDKTVYYHHTHLFPKVSSEDSGMTIAVPDAVFNVDKSGTVVTYHSDDYVDTRATGVKTRSAASALLVALLVAGSLIVLIVIVVCVPSKLSCTNLCII